VIPKSAYDELSHPTTPHLRQRIDYLISQKLVSLAFIDVGSDIYALYHKLTTSPDKGYKVIGPGEAASIALAKAYDEIVASNNLNDISLYISEFNLKYITTGDILIEALAKGYITENEGNAIWASMLKKRRRLGAGSFSEYIEIKNKLKNS